MDALVAANKALVFARHGLSKFESPNIRPRMASEDDKERWSMTVQAVNGPKGMLSSFRTKQDYNNITWTIPQVLAYGLAVAKLGVGNCMEFSALACVKLSKLKAIPDYYVCELGGEADHVFVVIGEAPDATGRFPMDFAAWDPAAAVCDPWSNISCLANEYPGEWKVALRTWHADGKELGIRKGGTNFGARTDWVAPTDTAWIDAPDTSPKVNKAGPGTGKEAGSRCCYITTATCRALGREDDCEELTTLRRFRDEVLMKSAAGVRDVAQYDRTAPLIVAAIDRNADAASIYRELYTRYIAPSVAALRMGDPSRAYSLFREMVAEGERLYLR